MKKDEKKIDSTELLESPVETNADFAQADSIEKSALEEQKVKEDVKLDSKPEEEAKNDTQVEEETVSETKEEVPSEDEDLFELVHDGENLHDTKFETKPVSYFRDCMRRFAKNKSSVVAFIIICIIALFGIFEPICDQKSYIESGQFGFNDPQFALALPKINAFKGSGFWDGTKVKEVGEIEYTEGTLTDSNYVKYTYLDKIEVTTTIGKLEYKQVTYKVREDSYAVGCKIIELSSKDYQKLVDFNQKRVDSGKKSVMKPLLNYSKYEADNGYIYRLGEELKALYPDLNFSPFETSLEAKYNSNNIYYQLFPKMINGKPSSNTFEPRYDENGKLLDIYLRDAEGNLVYSKPAAEGSDRVQVRVDYYDYFTYYYGFEPSFAFGMNGLGFDIMLKLAKGVRFSLLLGIGITIINFIIGLIWGSISGYYGGRVDLIMERFTDVIANIPTIIVLSIVNIQLVNGTAGAGMSSSAKIIIAFLIAFIVNGWVGVASTTRMQFYRFKGQEYVLASRTLGAKDSRLIFKHILPNAAGTLVTRSVLMVPGVIFSEASLSYLGIVDFSTGDISSIGAMINDGQAASIQTNPHVLLFPAIVISLLMISFNLFGNGLRDAFNTSLRGGED